ncbi:MAG: PQQ-binding-like beta-propeller repeat protein [Treponema sp.]|jgi:outer membrane protein assembly factor BamB|nr:PQQ-binding-like beta-propeller repeat protein [Treponema sp.]
MNSIIRTIGTALLLTGLILSLPAQQREPPVSADPIWEQDLRGTVIGLPTLQAESAVVVLAEGDVKSYSRFGNWLWTYNAKERLSPHVSRAREGTSYVCTESGTVIAVNRIGRELWKLSLGTPITAPIVVGWDGRLFIPAGQKMYCRTASGYSLWMRDLGSPIFVKPVLDHRGGTAMVLDNNEFTLVSHLSIVEKIQLNAKPLHIVPLPLDSGKDSFMLFYANGGVERIYRGAGNELVSERLPSLSQTPAAAVGWKDHVAVTLRDGRAQLLTVPGGEVVWTENSHETAAERGSGNLEPYWAAMQFDERGIYVLSTKGVTGFRESDGRRLWILRITGAAAIPSFSDEGYLYSGGTDHFLHAYRIEERKRNIARSVYGPAPEGSYGLGNPPPSSWSRVGEGRYDPLVIKLMHDEINAAIKNGQIGEKETDYVGYLIEVAGLSLSPTYSQVRPQVQILERAEAIRQLGFLGSRETVPFLARLFAHKFSNGAYEDPEILKACCEAIGRIGVDPAGDAIRAFTYLLAPDNATMDPAALMAAATATRDLCRFSGPPLADAGIRLLRAFTATDFPAVVKRHAATQLENLYK